MTIDDNQWNRKTKFLFIDFWYQSINCYRLLSIAIGCYRLSVSLVDQPGSTGALSTWHGERGIGETEMSNYKIPKPTNTHVILHQRWPLIPLVICEYISDLFEKVFWKLVNWHISFGEMIQGIGESTLANWSLAN